DHQILSGLLYGYRPGIAVRIAVIVNGVRGIHLPIFIEVPVPSVTVISFPGRKLGTVPTDLDLALKIAFAQIVHQEIGGPRGHDPTRVHMGDTGVIGYDLSRGLSLVGGKCGVVNGGTAGGHKIMAVVGDFDKIGRASCRERVEMWEGAGA